MWETIKKGFIEPNENQRVFVMLANGSITGAVYIYVNASMTFYSVDTARPLESKVIKWRSIPEGWES